MIVYDGYMNQIPEQLQGFLTDLDQKKKLADKYLAFLDDVTNVCQKHGFKSYRDYEEQLARDTSQKMYSAALDQLASTSVRTKRPFVTEQDCSQIMRMAKENTSPEDISKQLNFNVLLIKRWIKKINDPKVKFEYVKPGKKPKPDDTKGSETGVAGT
jgi:hypothetical protein